MPTRGRWRPWAKSRPSWGRHSSASLACHNAREEHAAMPHWEHRPEPKWQKFQFNQPYAKGLKRLKEEVLAKTDFDPTTLWQWGTMQAMALIEILKSAEKTFGE